MIKMHGSDPYKMCLCTFDFVLSIHWHFMADCAIRASTRFQCGFELLSPVKDCRGERRLSFWSGHKAFTTGLCWSTFSLLMFCFFFCLLIWKNDRYALYTVVKCLQWLYGAFLCDGTDDCEASMADTDLITTELICSCSVCLLPNSSFLHISIYIYLKKKRINRSLVSTAYISF